jgi:transcriptional regulator with XRE-family HTH domain
VQFCEEAEVVYSELGYTSAEQMIREGYELEPSQVELAVAWLRHNEPTEAVGIAEVSKRAIIQETRQEHPEWTQQQIADEVGVSKPYVSRVLTKILDSKESVNIPDHLTASDSKADYRKLPPDLQQAVAEREVSLNAAAIEAGIRKKPTAEETCLKAFRKAENRLDTLKRIIELLEPHERAVVMDWLEADDES